MEGEVGRLGHPLQQQRLKQHGETAGAGDMHHAPVGQVGRDAFAQALLFAAAGKAGFKQRFARRGQGETLPSRAISG